MMNPVNLNRNTPILACMDSGMGGIAYLDYLMDRAPNQPFVFVGDTHWMPYGDKPKPVVRERAFSIIEWFQAQHDIAAFVIACNTATGAVKGTLDESRLGYPMLTPIHVTANHVKAHFESKWSVGVLATKLSVEGHHYQHAFGPDWTVHEIACPGLADVIERGYNQGPVLEEALAPFIAQLKAAKPNIVVLGCTHYSLITNAIRAHIGPNIPIVDCSDVLAELTMQFITGQRETEPTLKPAGPRKIYVTHDAEGFKAAIGRLPFRHMQRFDVEVVNLTPTESTLPIL